MRKIVQTQMVLRLKTFMAVRWFDKGDRASIYVHNELKLVFRRNKV